MPHRQARTLAAIFTDTLGMTEKLIITIKSIIDLTQKEVGCIKLLWKEKSIKKGDFFLAEGQICKQVGFIVNGLIRYYINHDGEDKTSQQRHCQNTPGRKFNQHLFTNLLQFRVDCSATEILFQV